MVTSGLCQPQAMMMLESPPHAYRTVTFWAVLICATTIAFFAARGTVAAPLATGLLVSAVALLVALAIFEGIWWVLGRLSGILGAKDHHERTMSVL
jgi:hypothetical protein